MIFPRVASFAIIVLGSVLLASSASAQDRIAEYTRFKSEGKWPEALQALRDEVAKPRRTNDPDTHITNVRQQLMVALGEYAALHGFDDKTDLEVRRLYQQGARNARGNPEREATLENGMAVYFSKTLRNGLALPHMRRDLQHRLNTGDGFRIVLGHHALSAAYTDMGEVALAQYHLTKTLEAAKGYFVLGTKPAESAQWLEYWTLLGQFMTIAAQRGDRAQIDALWQLREPIAARYWKSNTASYVQAATTFATVGDAKRARELLREASRLWTRERPNFNANVQRLLDIAVQCNEGAVEAHLADFAAAVSAFERCDDMMKAAGIKDDDLSYTMRGIAYEGAGSFERAARAYQTAIDGAERTRGSYALAERANFFRTVVRRAYWGQIRVSARLAASGSDSARFFQALQISELVRARQLGELLDPEASRRISPDSLARLRTRLRADELVLAYTVTDRDIVLLAMSAASTRAILIPHEPRDFRALTTAIAAELARPDTALDVLNGKLAELGKLLLAPAAQELQSKKRITVLTDGLMNLVPFELLSYTGPPYRPLYRDFTVVNAPSLLFIEHAGRARRGGQPTNLFAMADPVYPKNPELASLPKEDAAIAARGGRHLAYFTPLPETRTEVQAIGGMFQGEKVDLILGDRALESTIKKANLAAYQYLHFATHGVIGNEVPGLQEPALVLGNEPGEDGFLTMTEVSKLKLDAELTVLSACNTGSGEFVEGEGVMGMSRAFLAAGSRWVVVSLWPVASQPTERLMVAFYRHMRTGKDAATALREAKLEMLERAQKSNSQEAHPFFWAPFILLGG